jgi:molybdopterin molybdotransferase
MLLSKKCRAGRNRRIRRVGLKRSLETFAVDRLVERKTEASVFVPRDMGRMVSMAEALEIVLNSVCPLGYEDISILEAADRVLYENIVSDKMIPSWDDSAKDGYAVRAGDIQGATRNSPVSLQIVGDIQAGESPFYNSVSKGTAVRIMTGAPIPEGADSVIEFEDTDEESGYVKVFRETVTHENRRFAGESIQKEETVLYKGDRLGSAEIGILASLNVSTVKVYKQPTVSIFSTGDELAEIGQEIRTGQIRNVNAHLLISEVKKVKALPDYLGIAKDTLKETRDILRRALKSDVIISTGGISRGKYDLVKEVYSDLNIELQFDRINVKPGTPCVFGKRDNKLIFGLPGNPVPTLISFLQLVRPALLKLMGSNRIKKPIVNAFLEENIHSCRVHHLLRGYFTIKNNRFHVSTTGNQKPSVLRSMSAANCLIIVPEHITQVRAGEPVTIQLIDHEEI